ncbi:hypothetical protein [Methylobacterium oxalidis]|uniref:hypothetical protein n=1 Tax=Methylobacterium oxalidis TaxID=944322 RepID=UPI0033152A9C
MQKMAREGRLRQSMTCTDRRLLSVLPCDEQARLIEQAAAAVSQGDRRRISQVLSEALAGLLLAGAFDDMSEAEVRAAIEALISELGISRLRSRR